MVKILKSLKKIGIYDIATFLLYLSSGMIITTAILFMLGITIGWLNFAIPLLVVSFFFIGREKDIWSFLGIFILSMCVFFIAIAISANVYDFTWDGPWYHKTAVGLLKNGWNPLRLSSEEFNIISKNNICATQSALQWSDCYPKGSWYFAGVIYFLTNNIEAGKAYTIIYMIVLFGMIHKYVMIRLNKKWKAVLMALLGMLNPIALCHMQTYYNDGLAGCILLALMIQILSLFDENEGKKLETYINVALLIVVGCNLKFSVTAFTAVICIVAYLMLVVKYRQRKYTINLFIYFAFSAFAAIILVGYAPYMTNIERYGNIIYGFSGILQTGGLENSFGIQGLSGVNMAIASLFGRMGNVSYYSLRELLKIPFTFSESELYYYTIADARTGGMGLFFSGLFLVSIIVAVWWVMKRRRQNLQEITAMLFIIIVILELLFLPGTYQIRYVPHFYMIFLTACYILLREQREETKIKLQYLICVFLTVVALANVFPWFSVAKNRMKEGEAYKAEFARLASEDTKNMTFAFWHYDYSGLYYNLNDYGIPVYSYADKKDLVGDVKYIYGTYIAYVINEE